MEEGRYAVLRLILNDHVHNLVPVQYVMLYLRLPLLLPPKPKQIGSHLAHLDLLSTLSNTVASKMAIDMLKGIMSRVAIATMDLCRS